MDGSLAPVIRGTTVVPHTLEIPMTEKLGQTERVAELITPLGKDVLALVRFEGTEGLGELFEYHVDALSKQENIDFDKALGQGCTLKLDAYRGKTRTYHAIMVEAQWIGKFEDLHRYRLVLRPWLWLLGHKANCRIFLDKDVKEIIKQIFTDAGFTDFEFRTNGDYDKIEYCVQYRETDLAFVCRLMELYGIYYFFEHTEGKHTLVLADMRSSHKAVSDLPKVPFLPLAKSQLRAEPHLRDWISERRFRTGKVEFNDYDYLKPTKNLRAPSEASEKYAHSKLEVYDFPGKYDEEEKGKKLSRFRLEAEQALDHRRIIHGDAASLYPGGLVTVEKHSTAAENREYLIVRCRHNFSGHHYLSASQPQPAAPSAHGAETDRPQVYDGLYEFQPSDRPFRMLPLTPKPRIHGIQTAKVVGKKGEEKEEISTDEHGRIWVQFFWDREPQADLPDSRRARLGGQAMGRDVHPAHRHGGRGRVPRRRPGPSAGGRRRLQRRQPRSLQAARQQDQSRLEVELVEGRQRLQRAHFRGQEGLRGHPHACREGPSRHGPACADLQDRRGFHAAERQRIANRDARERRR